MNLKRFTNNVKTFIVVMCLIFLLLICLGLIVALINNFDAISFTLFLIVGFAIIELICSLISDNKLSDKDEYFEYLEYMHKHINYNSHTIKNTNDIDLYHREELALCKKFIEKNPKNMYAQKEKAYLNLILNNYEDAVVDYTSLLSKEPTNKDYICGYARCYIGLKEYEKAKEILNTYYQNLDKDAKFYNTMGSIYYELGDLDLELEYNKRAAELNPAYQDILNFTLKRIEQDKT